VLGCRLIWRIFVKGVSAPLVRSDRRRRSCSTTIDRFAADYARRRTCQPSAKSPGTSSASVAGTGTVAPPAPTITSMLVCARRSSDWYADSVKLYVPSTLGETGEQQRIEEIQVPGVLGEVAGSAQSFEPGQIGGFHPRPFTGRIRSERAIVVLPEQVDFDERVRRRRVVVHLQDVAEVREVRTRSVEVRIDGEVDVPPGAGR